LLAQVVFTVASVLSAAISLATVILFARILFSWFRPNPPHGFLRSVVQAVYDVTDPVLDWLRVTFPFLVISGFDLSPLVAFFGLSLTRTIVVGGLTQWAYTLGG